MDKNLVDFIGIGFSKCGSTWVYECLKEHPEICTSTLKETRFFSRKFHKGFDWYKDQFSHCSEQNKLRGEFTPDYVFSPEVLERIKTYAPEAKLIIVVREPLERMKSMWRFQYFRGVHSYIKFEDYLKSNHGQIWHQTLYYKQLIPYFASFNQQQLLIIKNEDIVHYPNTVSEKIYSFLGVNDSFTPECIEKKINVSKNMSVASIRLNRFLHKVRHIVRNSSLGPILLPALEKIGLKLLFINIEHLNVSIGKSDIKLDDSLSTDLTEKIQKYFSDDYQKICNHSSILKVI